KCKRGSRNRGGRKPFRFVGSISEAQDFGYRCNAVSLYKLFTGQHKGRSTIIEGRGIGRCHSPILGEGRSKKRNFFKIDLFGFLVLGYFYRCTLPLGNLHWRYFGKENYFFGRFSRSAVALNGKFILRFT